MVQHSIVRPAGMLERHRISVHLLGFDSCVLCAAQYTHPRTRIHDPAVLFPALRKVVEMHAALGVHLVGESTQIPCFALLKGFDLSKVVEFSDSYDIQTIFEAQLLRPFDTNAPLPLWRVVVLRDNTLCFAWHHCIGDGKSGFAFHRSLLSALQEGGDTYEGTSYVAVPSTTTFLPPIETVTNLSPSWSKIFQELYDLFSPTSWTRGASAWTGEMVRGDATCRTHVRIIEFSTGDIEDFIVVCRRNCSTLTSAFHTLATSALSSLIVTEDPPAKYTTISSFIPISLRDVAGVSEDVFCDYVSTYHVYKPVQPCFSWVDTSEFTSALQLQKTKSREHIGMLRFLCGQHETYLNWQLWSKRQGGLGVSNLGRFKPAETQAGSVQKWSIGQMYFAQCDSALGHALKLNVVGNPLGGITITVTWGDGAVSDSLAETFIQRFQHGFDELLIGWRSQLAKPCNILGGPEPR